MERRVTIPYKPRTVQREIHAVLDARRFVVVAAHRRLGKTVLAVNHLIKRAIADGKKRGFYAYLAPFLKQGKAVAWDYLKHFTGVIPGHKFNEQELTVELPNRAKIRIFGADNPDALRGLYFDGIVLDEVAQMKPEIWEEIIRPALADRKGWAVFIGTPKGINLFHELYLKASKDRGGDWAAVTYPVFQTLKYPDPPLDEAEVDRMKAEMSDGVYRQELLCDFAASADDALIPIDLVEEAAGRRIAERDVAGLPLVVGVDVARFGSDASVFMRRQGRAAFEPLVLQGYDNRQVTERLISYCHEHQPTAVFVDSGQGQGVIDWGGRIIRNLIEVPFGSRAMNEAKFLNRRSEMWFLMREWLLAGGAIPSDARLMKELAAPKYGFNAVGKIQLESKEKIVERLGWSPDLGDALALTFAQPVTLALGETPQVQAIDNFSVWK
jgi:hypothetical protein